MEGTLLAAGGVLLGLVLARAGVELLPTVASSYLPRADEARLSGAAWAFAALLAAGTAVLFTLVPGLAAKRDENLAGTLRSGGRATTAGGPRQRYHRLLVAGQLAVTLPLLSGTVLLVSSFDRLLRTDPGFQASDLEAGAPPVLLVDEAWARLHFPGESALGRRLVAGGDVTGPRMTVVGVVGTVPYTGIGSNESGAVYEPGVRLSAQPFVVLRVAGHAGDAAALVRQALAELEPTAAVSEVATGEMLLEASLARPRHLTASRAPSPSSRSP